MRPVTRHLLILDVDETLVCAMEQPLPGREPDFRVGPYIVYKRPHLDEFLVRIADWYDLAVWSSASASYVNGIIRAIVGNAPPLKFIWSSDRCTRRYHPELMEHFWAKNLSKVRKLGYELERMLILDDSPEKVATHYGNHIRLRPFTGDPTDTELRDLLPFLDWLRMVENVRVVEKRTWRQFKDPPTGTH